MSGTSLPTGATGRPFPGGVMIRPNPFLGLLPAKMWSLEKDFFGYEADFVPLAAASTTPVNVTISNDAAFLVMAINAECFLAADHVTPLARPWPFLLQITDSLNRVLFNQPPSIGSLVGDAPNYGYLPFYKEYDPGTTLNVQVTNLAPATAYDLRLTLLGIKIFGYQAGS